MKSFMTALLLLVATSTASAFFAPFPAHFSRFISLHGTSRPDATDAVKEAMAATEKYGPTSNEARVAWDIVEEMDSSDSRYKVIL